MAGLWGSLKVAGKTTLKSIPILGNAVDTVRKSVPQLEDEVTVEVVGQPGSEKQELYFLALAAANGEVRRFNRFSSILAQCYGMLMIEFDQASNWVRVTIRYKISMLAANRSNTSIPLPRPGTFFDNLAVYRGPSCEVVGDNFDFIDSGIVGGVPTPGIPVSSISPDAPNSPNGLPFVGQVIVTPCPTTTPPVPKPIVQNPVPTAPKADNGAPIPSPNPKPPGDNRSRGAVVTSPLVTAELTGGNPLSFSGGVPGVPSSSSNGTSQSGVPPTPPNFLGSSGVGACCPKTLSLIPLIFAALSAPATDSQMRFTPPTQGPTGG